MLGLFNSLRYLTVKMIKISVTVITKDEEKNISDCLKSVEWLMK